METVPNAVGLATAHFAAGSRSLLVINATGSSFDVAEQLALERLRAVGRRFPDLLVELVCVPASEAEGIDAPPAIEMDVYRFEHRA